MFKVKSSKFNGKGKDMNCVFNDMNGRERQLTIAGLPGLRLKLSLMFIVSPYFLISITVLVVIKGYRSITSLFFIEMHPRVQFCR